MSQRISKATTLFYRYTYRRVSIDQATLKITPFLIPLLSQPVRLGLISGGFIQDRRDDPVDPHKGIYNTLDVGLAEHVVGSQRNFLRFLARNATYHPLGKKLVLARSTEFGDIYAFRYSGDVLDAIPLPERFFGGGGTSQPRLPRKPGRTSRPGDRLPAGGHGGPVQPDRAALPAGRRQYRRRAVSRRRKRLFQPRQSLVPREPAQPSGFRLHGPRRGLRHSLPHARRAHPRRPGVQHQSAALLWLQRNPAGPDQRGREPLRRRPPASAWRRA